MSDNVEKRFEPDIYTTNIRILFDEGTWTEARQYAVLSSLLPFPPVWPKYLPQHHILKHPETLSMP